MSNKTEKTELEILTYIAELLALGYINTAKMDAIKWYDSKLKGIEGGKNEN